MIYDAANTLRKIIIYFKNHVNVIVDSSSLRQSQERAKISPLNGNAYCPDLSNVLIDFGIPIMNDAVPMEEHVSETRLLLHFIILN